MADFTPEELATINEIMRQQSGAAMTPEEMQMMQMQPVQPQNFGALPSKESGAAPTPEEMQMRQQQQPSQNMQGEQGKAQYLQQQIEAIRSRMGGGAPQTGSQRVMDAMGTLPPQQGAMTDQEIAMMRGQR